MLVKRLYILYTIFFIFFVGLIARVAYIQFFSNKSLAESAFRQRLSNNSVEVLRGSILDKNGIPFTNRDQKYTAFIKSAFIPKSINEREKVCAALGINADALNNLTSKSKPLMVETNEEGSNSLIEMDLEWVSIIHSLNRYGSGTLAKHVIGYLSGKDRVGQDGVEKAYEAELRNDSLFEIGAVTDAAKNPIKGLGYRVKNWDTDEKCNVKLTLDYHIQKVVEDVMDRNDISGAVVVEDVVTGDVLAMASKPDFDQEAVENYLDSSGNELFNKATASYNLGSVFKIVDVAALFENIDSIPDIITGLDNYFCTGSVNINGLIFKCSSYLDGGHGEISLEQAFARSCNSYFIEMCQKIGYRNLISMAQKFGLGAETGISNQGVNETKGSLPTMNGYYSKADIANLAIGQGVLLATPLQVADIVATVANGGIKNRINIVDSVIDEDGRIIREIRVKQGQRIISKSTADKIKSLMEAVTAYGTGMEAGMDYYGGAGGKTGSAETGSKDVVHAWFAGYFPLVEPKYSIAVFVENGLYGGKAAAPVFAEIAREMTDKGYLKQEE